MTKLTKTTIRIEQLDETGKVYRVFNRVVNTRDVKDTLDKISRQFNMDRTDVHVLN